MKLQFERDVSIVRREKGNLNFKPFVRSFDRRSWEYFGRRRSEKKAPSTNIFISTFDGKTRTERLASS